MNSANLIPIARQIRNARHARLRRWAFVGGGTMALLAGTDVLLRVSFARSTSGDEFQSARLENEIAERTKSATVLRDEIQVIARQARVSRQVTEHPDYSVLLTMLSQAAGPEITLHQCALDRPQHGAEAANNIAPQLRLSGSGVSQSAVTSFVLRLEATGVFDRVTLLRSNEQNDVSGTTAAFQLDCFFDAAGRETP